MRVLLRLPTELPDSDNPDRPIDFHRRLPGYRESPLVEAPRPGVPRGMGESHGAVQLDMGLLEVSSTDIRRRIAEGRPYRFLVTSPVYEYIEATNLYADLSEGDMV